MVAITRLRLPVALIITSALAALLALVAFSPAAQAHHSWGKYHWARTSNPFTLKLGDNVSSGWDTYLSTASAKWSDSSVLDTKVVPGGTTRATCNPTSGMVEVCNYTYGTTGWLGVAQIWISGRNHIYQGTTKVNDTYFNSPQYNTPAWKQLVMCQEVAHTFGLDHQDERFNNTNLGTCMDYTNDPDGGAGGASATDPSNEHPNPGDYDELLCVYDPAYYRVTLSTETHRCTGTGHLDSTTTVGSASTASTMPPAANRGSFNSRAEWGRQVEESPNGNLELWVRDFGGEAKMITWVIRP